MNERELWNSWADSYDDSFLGKPDAGEVVRAVQQYTTKGLLLELGVGTGRIAIPLAKEGIHVDGVDFSERMAELLRQKAGGLPISVIVGDMADRHGQDKYEVVLAAHSALTLLQSQQEQLRCLQNTAAALVPGGHLIVESMHPQVFAGKLRGKNINVRAMGADYLDVSATIVDTSQQTATFQDVRMTEQGLKFFPCHVRWIWPSELDLMTQIAGLELVSRGQDWRGTVVTSESSQVISIYRKPHE
ncbi:class I SAM-dependent DNA methyltransferase [Streptomyces rubiginosohelvolus]